MFDDIIKKQWPEKAKEPHEYNMTDFQTDVMNILHHFSISSKNIKTLNDINQHLHDLFKMLRDQGKIKAAQITKLEFTDLIIRVMIYNDWHLLLFPI